LGTIKKKSICLDYAVLTNKLLNIPTAIFLTMFILFGLEDSSRWNESKSSIYWSSRVVRIVMNMCTCTGKRLLELVMKPAVTGVNTLYILRHCCCCCPNKLTHDTDITHDLLKTHWAVS